MRRRRMAEVHTRAARNALATGLSEKTSRVRPQRSGGPNQIDSPEGQVADLGVAELIPDSVPDPPLVGEVAADLVPRVPLEPHLRRPGAELLLVRLRGPDGDPVPLLPPPAVRCEAGVPPALGLQAVGDALAAGARP